MKRWRLIRYVDPDRGHMYRVQNRRFGIWWTFRTLSDEHEALRKYENGLGIKEAVNYRILKVTDYKRNIWDGSPKKECLVVRYEVHRLRPASWWRKEKWCHEATLYGELDAREYVYNATEGYPKVEEVKP